MSRERVGESDCISSYTYVLKLTSTDTRGDDTDVPARVTFIMPANKGSIGIDGFQFCRRFPAPSDIAHTVTVTYRDTIFTWELHEGVLKIFFFF